MDKILKPDEIPSKEKILDILNTAKNNAVKIAVELEINMNSEKIKDSFEKIIIRHLTEDEEESDGKEENDTDVTEEQNDIGSVEDFEEDFEDLRSDILMFKNQTELNLRDYTNSCTENNKSLFLDVNINGKKYVIRKSSLCWLYQNKNRLSSDRLFRVRGMNTNVSENVASINKKSNKKFKKLEIECEKYYCVYYDTGWHVGRVLHVEQNTCKIKFLYANLDEFKWPKKDDIQEVKKKFIMCGPISLNGTNPFTLSKEVRAEIQKQFKKFKSN